jgi:hypothetical protein
VNLNFVLLFVDVLYNQEKKCVFACRFSLEIVLYLMLDLDKVCRNLCFFKNFKISTSFIIFGIGLILMV